MKLKGALEHDEGILKHAFEVSEFSCYFQIVLHDDSRLTQVVLALYDYIYCLFKVGIFATL